jgi:hypothetical protein
VILLHLDITCWEPKEGGVVRKVAGEAVSHRTDADVALYSKGVGLQVGGIVYGSIPAIGEGRSEVEI